MSITSAKYVLSHTAPETGKKSITIVIDGQNYSVPMNEDNRHYQEILEWVADGNTIEEAD